MKEPIYNTSNKFQEEDKEYEKEQKLREEIVQKDKEKKEELEETAKEVQLNSEKGWFHMPKFGGHIKSNGDNFIKEVLEGKLDFSGMSLNSKFSKGLNLNNCNDFDTFIEYLSDKLANYDPSLVYRFDKVDFGGLRATDIIFPSFYAPSANLKKAELTGDISNLYFDGETELAGSKLELTANGLAYKTKFAKVNLTNFYSDKGFMMSGCDLRGVIGLETTQGIYFKDCIVSPNEVEIINELMDQQKRSNILYKK
jgi:hypothetical protein